MQNQIALPQSAVAGRDPIELSPGIWWVGSHLDGDSFQCHAYLIECGDQSVLFDPGSVLTWDETLRKIETITSLDNIRWFVLHHQDPDICGAMGAIEKLVTRKDARWVSHWRAEVLLKHNDPKMPFHRIEDHDWKLDLGERELEFVFTPYLHFPGAFATFDSESGILFSSDLFGGFTEGSELIVQNQKDFDGVGIFHEHYMPSHEALLHTLVRIEQLPLQAIAPQHGRIITGDHIQLFINRLKDLDCGLFLLTKTDSNVEHLQSLNDLLRDTMDVMVLEKDFRVIARHILERINRVVPTEGVEFLAQINEEETLHLSSSDRFRGRLIPTPICLRELSGVTQEEWTQKHLEVITGADPDCCPGGASDLSLPLFSSATGKLFGLATFRLQETEKETAEFGDVLAKVALPLAVACEREIMYRQLEMERDVIYERSIRDPLTGLFTRRYLDDAASRMVELHLRDPEAGFSMIMADIDFFKKVNDTHGHLAGDQVLESVGEVLLSISRQSDVAVRFGGEEFALFLPLTNLEKAERIAERIRKSIEAADFITDEGELKVTISLGVASHLPEESIDEIFQRADIALYEAKESGRNKVCCSESSPNS